MSKSSKKIDRVKFRIPSEYSNNNLAAEAYVTGVVHGQRSVTPLFWRLVESIIQNWRKEPQPGKKITIDGKNSRDNCDQTGCSVVTSDLPE